MKTVVVLLALGLLATVGCAAAPRPSSPRATVSSATPEPTTMPGSAAPGTGATASAGTASIAPAPSDQPGSPAASPEPIDSGGSTTGGDIPDNAIFLTYHDIAHGFSIEYVEGWQVTPGTDGVGIRDKDSSETVQIVPGVVSDVPGYISATDLTQLQTLAGFQLDKQDTVNVNGTQLNHLVYHAPSPPDPVTGKEVASTIDRYYVPGATGLAIVTLSTPDGVDNVDAFREMIKSFTWD